MAINNYSQNWFDDFTNSVVSVAPGHNTITASNASAIMANRLSPSMLAQMNMEEMHHTMKGEMVSCGLQITEMQKENMIHNMTESGFKAHIKQQLCELLVKDMMKKELIEYTMTNDPAYLTNTYRARAYLMPDGMVKILREYITRNT